VNTVGISGLNLMEDDAMKKIRMTRVLALAMALVMALALVACGGTKSGPKKTDEELIVGKWETNIDFGKVMEDAMKEGGDEAQMLGDVDFSGITMKMNAEFKADVPTPSPWTRQAVRLP
jgi:hypothetical protein